MRSVPSVMISRDLRSERVRCLMTTLSQPPFSYSSSDSSNPIHGSRSIRKEGQATCSWFQRCQKNLMTENYHPHRGQSLRNMMQQPCHSCRVSASPLLVHQQEASSNHRTGNVKSDPRPLRLRILVAIMLFPLIATCEDYKLLVSYPVSARWAWHCVSTYPAATFTFGS